MKLFKIGFETCHGKLKDKPSYTKLGEEALRQGNHQVIFPLKY